MGGFVRVNPAPWPQCNGFARARLCWRDAGSSPCARVPPVNVRVLGQLWTTPVPCDSPRARTCRNGPRRQEVFSRNKGYELW